MRCVAVAATRQPDLLLPLPLPWRRLCGVRGHRPAAELHGRYTHQMLRQHLDACTDGKLAPASKPDRSIQPFVAVSPAHRTLRCTLLQAPMFIFRPTKFAAIYTLGNVLSLCRWAAPVVQLGVAAGACSYQQAVGGCARLSP